MIISPKGTDEEEGLVKCAGREVQAFVKKRWNETEWETAWFVNPPVSLSWLLYSQRLMIFNRGCRAFLGSLIFMFTRNRRLCPMA
jgi:hypothetical protein